MRSREFLLGHSTILPAIWSRLGKVRAFATVISNGGLNGQVIGHIEGEALPTLDSELRHLRIAERGWMALAHNARSFTATNVYNWRFEDHSVALDYDRSNGWNLVPLVIFQPVSASVLASQRPHYCGNDCYWARLEIADDAVILRWYITGPNKHYGLTTRYTAK